MVDLQTRWQLPLFPSLPSWLLLRLEDRQTLRVSRLISFQVQASKQNRELNVMLLNLAMAINCKMSGKTLDLPRVVY